ncbi:MAG TPA: hypothetical protein VHV57_09720 [Acidimicrobiales bacterium]|nr:hypothetical protein [Acidimicrobiales bacterium]
MHDTCLIGLAVVAVEKQRQQQERQVLVAAQSNRVLDTARRAAALVVNRFRGRILQVPEHVVDRRYPTVEAVEQAAARQIRETLPQVAHWTTAPLLA